MKIMLAQAPVFAAAFAVSACTIFPEQEAPRLMDLALPASAPTFETTRNTSLRIDTPLASAPLDSPRILIKPDAYEFQALPDTRWRDSMPVVLRDYLVQDLRQSGGFDSVLNDTSTASAELSLVSELTGFHAVREDGKTTVVVRLYTEMMENRSRKSWCRQDHHVQTPAASTDLNDLMNAFSESARQLSADIALWAHQCRGNE